MIPNNYSFNQLTPEELEYLRKNFTIEDEVRFASFRKLEKEHPNLYEKLLTVAHNHPSWISEVIARELGINFPKKEKHLICVVCGKPAKWNNLYNCYRPTCGAECGRKLSMLNLQKYMVETYGVENSSQLSKTVELKRKNMFERMKKRIGPEISFIDDPEKFLREGNSHIDEEGHLRWHHYKVRCNVCGEVFMAFLGSKPFRKELSRKPVCPKCVPRMSGYSLAEREISNFVKENYDGQVIENSRRILKDRRELDIYLPDINLAIEYNGLAFHCENPAYEVCNGKRKIIDESYHLNKTLECEAKGIQLIHIFEDEWNEHKEIVKSILLHKLGKKEKVECTEVKQILKKLAKTFLEKTNIFGFEEADSYAGLYSGNELIAVGAIRNKELIRFSQHLSKEIENALDYLDFDKAIIDRRYFTGNSFKGFSKAILPPKTFYTDFYSRIEESFTDAHRIWDCGYFELTKV